MAMNVQLVKPFKFERLTRVLRVRGTYIYIHWTVFLISGLLILAALRHPWVTLAAGAAWLGLIFIHECGHMLAAERKGCAVPAIDLYPIHGCCHFDQPWSRYDHCVIAWGGVIAQAVVAVPMILALLLFGYSRFEPINAVMVILGGYSVLTAVYNLLPIRPLDGAIAWGIIPEAIRRAKSRRKKKDSRPHWRSY